jgi:hypothetical protein
MSQKSGEKCINIKFTGQYKGQHNAKRLLFVAYKTCHPPPPQTVGIWNRHGKQGKIVPYNIIILQWKDLLTEEEC